MDALESLLAGTGGVVLLTYVLVQVVQGLIPASKFDLGGARAFALVFIVAGLAVAIDGGGVPRDVVDGVVGGGYDLEAFGRDAGAVAIGAVVLDQALKQVGLDGQPLLRAFNSVTGR